MSVDKFIAQYQAFSVNPIVASLTEASKVTLFQTYCQCMTANAKPQQQSQPQAAPKSAGPPASPKQIGLIRSLMNDGSLEADVLKNRLTLKEASNLIEKGLANRQNNAEVQEELVEQPADYAGAFNWGGA